MTTQDGACDPPNACAEHGRCWTHSIEDKCECGSNDFTVSATFIECKACGRTWGRTNGKWVLDPDTVPTTAGYDPHMQAVEALFRTHHVDWGTRIPEAGKKPCGLTFDELIAACRNVGVDLTCGGCAANFFTGTGASSHDEGCKTIRAPDVKIEALPPSPPWREMPFAFATQEVFESCLAGMKVLRTMCRIVGFTQAAEVAEQTIKQLEELFRRTP